MSLLNRILFLSEELADDYADYEYDNFEKTKKATRKVCDRFSERHGALENIERTIKKYKEKLKVLQTAINKKRNTSEDLRRYSRELEDLSRKIKQLENKKDRMMIPKMSIQESSDDYNNSLYEKENNDFEERTPIEGFKVGDFVKVVKSKVGSSDNGKFGILESMKGNGKPDLILFVSKAGKESDESDFANKFELKPAKKCDLCRMLYAVDELIDYKGKKFCKNCSKNNK